VSVSTSQPAVYSPPTDLLNQLRLAPGSRIAVAMSGGVDSSAVAGLLVEAGLQVIGLTARLYDVAEQDIAQRKAGSCCAPEDARDARTVAQQLGMRHYVLDEREVFARDVIAPFVRDWQEGRTPNPCVQCNRSLKFDRLTEMARKLGCQALATGHYARLLPDASGTLRLLRGVDPAKDQAYFLWPMRPDTAQYLRFPIGGLTKHEVRGHAERLGLLVATKAESMDICFVGHQTAQQYVESKIGKQDGPLLDASGKQLGQHRGLAGLTIGQRHGLGLPPQRADADPLYVVDKRSDGTVIVGPKAQLKAAVLELAEVMWLAPPPPLGSPIQVQVRHRGQAVSAHLVGASETTATVAVSGDLFAAAAGQSAVLWQPASPEPWVLGGGVLSRVGTAPAAEAA